MWCFFHYVGLFSLCGAFVRAYIELTKVEFFEDRGNFGVDVSITLNLQINNGEMADILIQITSWYVGTG